MKDDFLSSFDGLLHAVQGVQTDLKEITIRVNEAEDQISTNQDDIASVEAENAAMKAAVKELMLKVDDLENRSRRSNLHILGIPEGKEGSDVCNFLEGWLPEMLGAETYPRSVQVERAHRLGRASGAGTPGASGKYTPHADGETFELRR